MVKDDASFKSAMCYLPVVGFVVSLVFLVLEPENKPLKWQALQSILFSVAVLVVSIMLGATVILAAVAPLVNVAAFVVQLVLLVKTYQGEKVNLPLISEWATKLTK